jgi:anti-anti-sigma factor
MAWIRLVWAGDIDAFSVRPLASSLRESLALDPQILEVDLAGVTFLDSSGLRPLVEAHTRLTHRVRLYDPAPAVTRLLRLLGLEDLFLVVGPIPAAAAPAPGELGLPLSTEDRVTIEQAKGLLMAVDGCDASAASEILRTHAKAHDVRIQVMARRLVAHAPGAAPQTSETVVEDVMAELARAGPPGD